MSSSKRFSGNSRPSLPLPRESIPRVVVETPRVVVSSGNPVQSRFHPRGSGHLTKDEVDMYSFESSPCGLSPRQGLSLFNERVTVTTHVKRRNGKYRGYVTGRYRGYNESFD